MSYKEKILNELKQVNRKGIDNLIKMLGRTDFFTAPASRKYHLNYEGGLAEHSWNVYQNYLHLRDKYGLGYGNSKTDLEIPLDSVRLEAFGHDVCKVGLYCKDEEIWSDSQKDYIEHLLGKNAVDLAEMGFELDEDSEGEFVDLDKSYASDLITWLKKEDFEREPPKKEVNWVHDNSLPVGHGEKSVMMLQRFIKLDKREILAIRWHMGAWEDGVLGGGKQYDFNDARDMFPDVHLLQLADYEASFKEDWIG